MNIIEEIRKAGEQGEYRGYYYSLSHIIEMLILGLLCRLQTLKDIHLWASATPNRNMLELHFGIRKIPCYSHFTNLVGLLSADELNKIFMEFFQKLVQTVADKTIAIDGKTVCATANMADYKSPLHIASAFVAENGITLGQLATEAKSNEIPAVQELIRLLNIEGALIVTDALNCQKATAKAVLDGGGDYLFAVKKNHRNLYDDISEMIEFKQKDKVESRETPLSQCSKADKGHGRVERRSAYVTQDVEWLLEREKWPELKTIGAVKNGGETRYYISSRALSAQQLLDASRREWAVESMHWQLDVVFDEDRTTLHEETAQKAMNILRKTALNIVRIYRDRFEPRLNMSDIMRKASFDAGFLIRVLRGFGECSANVTN